MKILVHACVKGKRKAYFPKHQNFRLFFHRRHFAGFFSTVSVQRNAVLNLQFAICGYPWECADIRMTFVSISGPIFCLHNILHIKIQIIVQIFLFLQDSVWKIHVPDIVHTTPPCQASKKSSRSLKSSAFAGRTMDSFF